MLMDELYSVQVNGKMWRLLRDWCDGGSSCIKVEGRLSWCYPVERVVKQGSVLFPVLLIGSRPSLRELQASKVIHQ